MSAEIQIPVGEHPLVNHRTEVEEGGQLRQALEAAVAASLFGHCFGDVANICRFSLSTSVGGAGNHALPLGAEGLPCGIALRSALEDFTDAMFGELELLAEVIATGTQAWHSERHVVFYALTDASTNDWSHAQAQDHWKQCTARRSRQLLLCLSCLSGRGLLQSSCISLGPPVLTRFSCSFSARARARARARVAELHCRPLSDA